MRKIYSFLKGMSAVKSLFLSLLCLWGTLSVSAQITINGVPQASGTTIKQAVAAAPSGATIIVPAGNYNEVDIPVDKSLTILGPFDGTSPNNSNGSLLPLARGAEAVITTIPGVPMGISTDFHAAFIVKPTSGNDITVTIKGFTFKNGSPLQDGHSGPQIPKANIIFQNNIIDDGQLIYGGYYWSDIDISNNNFNNSTPVPGAIGLADAVYILGGKNVNVSDNVIRTAFVGILVKGQDLGGGQNPPINQILIQRNRVSTTTEEAIQIGELIVNSTVSENETNGATNVGGIRIFMPTVTGRVDIRNNIIKSTPAGVILTEGNASQEIYVNYNSLDITNAKSIINNGTGTLKATCNWLGTADCAGIEGRVTGSVIFSPFLQNGVDDAPATIGFQTSAPCAICCTLAATLASKTDVQCFGGNDGTASFNITGGTGSYTITYVLNGGGTTASSNPATGLVAGSYIFTIKDNANACTATVPVIIGQPLAALSATETHTDVNCFGNATGAIDLSVSGGTAPYTYVWTASAGGVVPAGQSTNQDLTGLVAGTYSVMVTDANKCTTSKAVTIAQPAAALTATATQVNTTCSGATGSIDLTVTGGTPPYTYAWTASAGGVVPAGQSTNQDLTGLVGGTYSVTVTDFKGCTAMKSVTITSTNSNISATETHTDVNCFGNATGAIDLSVSGGTAPYTYVWTASAGGVVPAGQSTNQDLTGLVAGTYTVMVTDANKCATSKAVTIAQPAAALTATATQVNTTCTGATGSIDLTVTGGTPPYTYAWTASAGGAVPAGQSTNQDLTGLVGGTYSVTVTDFKGCTAMKSVTITSTNSNISATETHTDVNCFGNATGAIDLSISGGTAPYTYAWTASAGGVVPAGQSTNQDLTGLVAGTYTVMVTDANKCATSKAVTIMQPASALTATETHTNIDCTTPGAINLTVSGGTPNYTYLWTATNGGAIPSGQADDQDLTGLTAAGTYSVLVTDAKGCTKTVVVAITKTDCPPPVCTLKASITNKVDVTCFGGNNGSVTIAATGGTPPYTGTGTFSNLKAGNYSYKVKDYKGCEVYVSFYIDEPDELKAPYTQKNVTCKGASDGSVTFTITGGTSPYVIKNVTTGANNLSNPVTGLKAGTYSFLITDKNGCCKTVSVCITEPSTPCAPVCTLKATITDKDDVTCYGGNNGSVTITATGGTAPYTGTGTFKNLKAGNYSYKVKDYKGCEVYVSFNIDEPDELKVSTTQVNVSCKDATDGSVKFTISGGTSPYVIKNVTTGANNLSNPVTGLKDGTYSFLITDKNGCCKTVSVCITEPSTPCVIPCKVTVTTVAAPFCVCNVKGSATITITGGKAPFKYTFNPGNITGTTSDRSGTVELNAGNYTIKVTDALGCVSSASFTVKETEPITGTIGVKLNTTFPGQKPHTIYIGYNTQYATLSADNIKGGTPPYTYKWYPSTGLATPNDDETKATPTCTTTYTLLVTDSKGCKFYKCVTIKVVDLRCGAYNNKVEICCKGKTLCVDKNLVSGYLATGSTLGSCGCDDDDDNDDDRNGNDRNWGTDEGATAAISDDEQAAPSVSVGSVFPNPTGGIFRVTLDAMNVPVQIVVGDANGKPISTVSRINSTTAGQTVDFNLSNQPVGMYLVRVVQGQVRKTYKVFIVR